MPAKRLLCVGMAVLLAMTGCGKKKDQTSDLDALSDLAELETKTKSDSGDIFDEFYDDVSNEGAAGMETPAAEEPMAAETFVSSSDYVPEFIPDGRYVVQVSTVRSEALAESVVRRLEARGWPAYMAQVENPTPELIGTYYRVRIGGFNYVTPARAFGERVLNPEGYEFWVDNRSNDNIGMGGYGLGESDVSDYSSTSSSTTSSDTWGTTTTETSTSTTDDWGTTNTTTSTTTSDDWGTTSEPAAAEPTPATTTTPAASEPAPAASEPAAAGSSTKPTDSEWKEDDWGDDSGW